MRCGVATLDAVNDDRIRPDWSFPGQCWRGLVPCCWWRPKSAEKWRTQDMGVDFLDRRVLAKRVVDGRKPASGHESQLRQGVASGHPQGRSAAKEPQSGLTRRNPLTFDPTCCGFSHSLFAIYARFYAAVNTCWEAPKSVGSNGETVFRLKGERAFEVDVWTFNRRCRLL